jgi:hypothetical protein
MNTNMTTAELLEVAKSHTHREQAHDKSSVFCIEQGIKLSTEGREDLARAWIVRSLKYSVGIFHSDFKRANQALEGAPRF